ncbi:phosphate ABC transporter substrate-binding protein [Inhella gelatinilytica]|uniref:Phosphate ABC transporter substrate-binding protein n=1 Tax=Inhella gelatinilytica TaxID=2795030 RepID=A0A931IWA7_9BURK|nr:phosphate ABC transporter substrate-binding protein [Inhella gelatinilytica]MBH9552209.1 phosphate ABC transporter substrate-binding protein [Inhella gelatinilytica]
MAIRVVQPIALVLALMAGDAMADVVVVVSAKSPLAKLDKAAVTDLYLGATKEAPGLGQATLVALAPPVRDEFYAKVLGKEASQVKAIWSRLIFSGKGIAPKELTSAAEVKALLAGNPNAIGYVDKADVDASVKVVFAP